MQNISVITPQELSSERRWWAAMGFPFGAPELIKKHGLEHLFVKTYHRDPKGYFEENPEYAFDPTLFDELTSGMKDRPRSLPLMGPPVSLPLREAAAARWLELGMPGPIEFFVQNDLYEEMKEALGGWDPQAVLEIFPEHSDGVVLSSILWWHHALRGSADIVEPQASALRALSPLVHQYEIESALEANMVRSQLH